MSNRTEGRRIAIAHAPGLYAAARNALAERIDRAIGAAKKRGEERGARKAEARLASAQRYADEIQSHSTDGALDDFCNAFPVSAAARKETP